MDIRRIDIAVSERQYQAIAVYLSECRVCTVDVKVVTSSVDRVVLAFTPLTEDDVIDEAFMDELERVAH